MINKPHSSGKFQSFKKMREFPFDLWYNVLFVCVKKESTKKREKDINA